MAKAAPGMMGGMDQPHRVPLSDNAMLNALCFLVEWTHTLYQEGKTEFPTEWAGKFDGWVGLGGWV